VITVEKDSKMCEILEETLSDFNNIEIIQDDVLKLNNFKLISNFKFKISNYKIVANLPYYITSPVIRKFLENPPNEKQPELMVLMLQKEVAQRICAKPPNMSILSVSVQFYAKPVIMSYVSKGCFWPSPKVDSAIIRIIPKNLTSREIEGRVSPDLFFKIVKAGFSQPRKQLGNNLSKMLKLDKQKIREILLQSGIDPKRRAEALEINDWLKLIKLLKNSPY